MGRQETCPQKHHLTHVSLTTSIDAPGTGAFAGSSPFGNANVYGVFGNATGNTFNPGDQIIGTGTNNSLILTDGGAGANANVTGIASTVSGIRNLNVSSGEALTVNTLSTPAGFTGITQATVRGVSLTGIAGNAVTVAGTTNVNLTDNSTSTTAGVVIDQVTGGANVAVTANVTQQAGAAQIINVGEVGGNQTTAPTGTVTITETVNATGLNAMNAAAINVRGGTSVNVTANLLETAGAGNTVTGGQITVNGTTATTTVTVNQTAAATAAAEVLAVVGVSGATRAAVNAGPGIQALAARTQATAVNASAAVAGVVDGAVVINDNGRTITSVTLGNFGAGSQINSSAVNTVVLNGATVTAANAPALTIVDALNTVRTLGLTVNSIGNINGITSANFGRINYVTLTDNTITTLNLATATANSHVNLVGAALTTLNISGTNDVRIQNVAGAINTISVSGSAGFNDSGSLQHWVRS